MKRLFATQPFLTTAFVTALVDLIVAYGVPLPPGAKAPIISIVTMIGAWLVHQTVSSPATVAEVARKTAETLDGPTAGAIGTITTRAEGLIDAVVGEVGGLIPALAPKAKGN